ncbi:MAG: protein-L-isoaspartate(D-aspartate) O-methyltransferase [Betaproteobacteria bacterium]|nr:MAG: protein-L-isoaspartate(D-aspartate) O-methyltransferase [Betaproteobacteria bacterium]
MAGPGAALSATPSTGLTSERVRARMVDRVQELGVRDPRVLAAMRCVERHRFVDQALASRAYEDTALPIGFGQTISQPYIVGRCAELALSGTADPKSVAALEVGTGGGYAAAVLSELFGTVFSIERVRALHELARANLRPLRIANLRLAFGDGMLGLPTEAPFGAIVSTAAGDDIPAAWIEQLAPGGVIVAPLGRGTQVLTVLSRSPEGRLVRREHEAVRFVPLLQGTVTAENR